MIQSSSSLSMKTLPGVHWSHASRLAHFEERGKGDDRHGQAEPIERAAGHAFHNVTMVTHTNSQTLRTFQLLALCAWCSEWLVVLGVGSGPVTATTGALQKHLLRLWA